MSTSLHFSLREKSVRGRVAFPRTKVREKAPYCSLEKKRKGGKEGHRPLKFREEEGGISLFCFLCGKSHLGPDHTKKEKLRPLSLRISQLKGEEREESGRSEKEKSAICHDQCDEGGKGKGRIPNRSSRRKKGKWLSAWGKCPLLDLLDFWGEEKKKKNTRSFLLGGVRVSGKKRTAHGIGQGGEGGKKDSIS